MSDRTRITDEMPVVSVERPTAATGRDWACILPDVPNGAPADAHHKDVRLFVVEVPWGTQGETRVDVVVGWYVSEIRPVIRHAPLPTPWEFQRLREEQANLQDVAERQRESIERLRYDLAIANADVERGRRRVETLKCALAPFAQAGECLRHAPPERPIETVYPARFLQAADAAFGGSDE